MKQLAFIFGCVLLSLFACQSWADDASSDNTVAKAKASFERDVAPFLDRYCAGCHYGPDGDAGVDLSTFDGLMRGKEGSELLNLKEVDASRILKLIDGSTEPAMPPKDEPQPSKQEIAKLKAWIVAGAPEPSKDYLLTTRMANIPDVEVQAAPRLAVHAAEWSPNGEWIALAKYGRVLVSYPDKPEPITMLEGLSNHVNDVAISRDGKWLLAASGEPGLFGELTVFSTETWEQRHQLRAHNDACYAVAISHDGELIATGGYDQRIIVYSAEKGTVLRELKGHNGAVFDLDFRPGTHMLASASADRTIKLWDADSGTRLDTLNEPELEQYAVKFSPDGKRVVGAGVDNRIRVWRVSRAATEGTNPMLHARFAHESAILNLGFTFNGQWLYSTSEDLTLKVWETNTYTQRGILATYGDWPTALTTDPKSERFVVGLQDGTWSTGPLPDSVKSLVLSQPMESLPVAEANAAMEETRKIAEVEPREGESAQLIPVPATVTGAISGTDNGRVDTDTFRFSANEGAALVLETKAARMKSPLDTRIQVFHANGEPVERLWLRAVRDSYVTFRPVNSSRNDIRVKNWEEMDLNEYLYLNGEVLKILRMPRGPDSGFRFFESNGMRRNYFDTSGVAHALEEPCYIVEPYLPGAKLVDNGLPVFPLYYENDDDAMRVLGTDSRLLFTAPKTGEYLVRVSDTRGFEGDDYKYELTIRPAQPGFAAKLELKNKKIGRGSGQDFVVKLDRIDEFAGEVRIDFSAVPEGITISSPIVVEAGHLEAHGAVYVSPDAGEIKPEAFERIKVSATGTVNGEQVVKPVSNFGPIELQPTPKLRVHLWPDDGSWERQSEVSDEMEIVVVPGEMRTAMLTMDRLGFEGEMKFEVNNLPHGVYVDNIGLSGVLIREGETQRQIFLTCLDWVPEQTRLIHAVTQGQGNRVTRPIRIRVERNPESGEQQARAK